MRSTLHGNSIAINNDTKKVCCADPFHPEECPGTLRTQSAHCGNAGIAVSDGAETAGEIADIMVGSDDLYAQYFDIGDRFRKYAGSAGLIETYSNPQQSWGESCTLVAINGVPE